MYHGAATPASTTLSPFLAESGIALTSAKFRSRAKSEKPAAKTPEKAQPKPDKKAPEKAAEKAAEKTSEKAPEKSEPAPKAKQPVSVSGDDESQVLRGAAAAVVWEAKTLV